MQDHFLEGIPKSHRCQCGAWYMSMSSFWTLVPLDFYPDMKNNGVLWTKIILKYLQYWMYSQVAEFNVVTGALAVKVIVKFCVMETIMFMPFVSMLKSILILS